MKILYAIQGTGNGHISRARDIVPILQSAHDVDLLLSGTQADVELPFHIKYRLNGLSFVFGKKGGIDLYKTYNNARLGLLIREINALPVEEYDLVINDFEPVSAWACHQKGKLCIALSHQAAVLNKQSPRPGKTDILGLAILKHYAPAHVCYGFHFKQYAANIFTPVIRAEVRTQRVTNEGHYTVYLPAYDDKRIIRILKKCAHVQWQVFSKHAKKSWSDENIHINPITNQSFVSSMAAASGILCGAGFETPAEALYLGKKLVVIPMKGQYEQQCNAAALKEMGVNVLKSLKKKHIQKIQQWLNEASTISVDYPDCTSEIIYAILNRHTQEAAAVGEGTGKKMYKQYLSPSETTMKM